MVSFESDYNNGMLPEILERLAATNDEKCSGYGYDPYSESAKAKIISAIGKEDAEVFFLVGGTQTNATVIDSLLLPCEGVICVETAHIAVHESGAVEASGHKVITLPTSDSKMDVASLKAYMNQFLADETYPHMVQPGMVYITMPTEHGMVYTRDELALLYDTCRHYNLKLYVDGARLGYGLTSNACDYDLKFLAAHCDAFYIGGTKVGAMMGEAVVFSNIPAPKYFFTTVKRHGALLAKGRMIGIQFDTLFTDGLYFRISRHAIDMAVRLKEIFASSGIPLAVDSPTNQQFAILNRNQYNFLSNRIKFEIWEPSETDEIVCRFVTS
jgi:threonine aldolase